MDTEELLGQPIDQLLAGLKTSQSGLTSQGAENLLKIYLMLVEIVKKWFVKRYAYRLEQVLVPQREWRKRLNVDKQLLYTGSVVSKQR